MFTPMTETELLAFLDKEGGKLNVTDVNRAAAEALAAKGVLKLTVTRRKMKQMGVVIGATMTRT